MFGVSTLFDSNDLVSDDNLVTRDENGEDPGYDAKGPTGRADLAGDTSDDDGQALDDYLTPNPQGILGIDPNDSHVPSDIDNFGAVDDAPTMTATERIVATPFAIPVSLTDQDEPENIAVVVTRVIRARIPIGAGYDPQMLLPRDPNRVHLILVGDDDFQFGSAKSDVYEAGNFPGSLGMVLDKHTGPVWAYNPNAAAGSYVKCWAVTK